MKSFIFEEVTLCFCELFCRVQYESQVHFEGLKTKLTSVNDGVGLWLKWLHLLTENTADSAGHANDFEIKQEICHLFCLHKSFPIY